MHADTLPQIYSPEQSGRMSSACSVTSLQDVLHFYSLHVHQNKPAPCRQQVNANRLPLAHNFANKLMRKQRKVNVCVHCKQTRGYNCWPNNGLCYKQGRNDDKKTAQQPVSLNLKSWSSLGGDVDTKKKKKKKDLIHVSLSWQRQLSEFLHWCRNIPSCCQSQSYRQV